MKCSVQAVYRNEILHVVRFVKSALPTNYREKLKMSSRDDDIDELRYAIEQAL